MNSFINKSFLERSGENTLCPLKKLKIKFVHFRKVLGVSYKKKSIFYLTVCLLILTKIPMAPNDATIADPPRLIKGNGTPVIGIRFIIPPILINA